MMNVALWCFCVILIGMAAARMVAVDHDTEIMEQPEIRYDAVVPHDGSLRIGQR